MERIIKAWDTVRVHYTGRLENDEIFDSSYTRNQPLEFTVGGGQMIKGFNAAVYDMKDGEKKTVTIPAAHAYGEKNPDLIQPLERHIFAGMEIEIGQQFSLWHHTMTIIEIKEDLVTVDLNHHLAGKDLIFDIEVVEIL